MLAMAIVSALISFAVSVILGKKLIVVLKSIKMGQTILEIGPRWHKSKEGTPTMGGLFFIGGITLSVIIMSVYAHIKYGVGEIPLLLINYAFILFCGLVGFADDYVKFFKKQNKGLSAGQKLVLQFASATVYVFAHNRYSPIGTSLDLPFTDKSIDFGIFYFVFLIIGIVFTVNSVNLTDGIDGLASSVTAVAVLFLAIISYKTGSLLTLILLCATLGGCLGFLVYNFYPAKVFMGDTGSLFLGGVVSAVAIWFKMPWILVFVGIMYFAEAMSVVIQVISYKLFKKRVFKMSPLHHHFEMCGWSEIKIVFVFSLVTAIMSLVGVYGFLIN